MEGGGGGGGGGGRVWVLDGGKGSMDKIETVQ